MNHNVIPLQAGRRHPCFQAKAGGSCGRVHLPVAPACNIQCNYCNRKYSCVNESRPGVTGRVITPDQAVQYVREKLAEEPRITVAGIAGPGDPLADPARTLETFSLVGKAFPGLILCLSTNGLNGVEWAEKLVKAGVGYATITLNSIQPAIGRKIYSRVHFEGRSYDGLEGADLLQARQLETIRIFLELGVEVKVNTVVIPGVNDHHVPAIAEKAAGLGVGLMNCLPMIPVAGTPFYGMGAPDKNSMHRIKQKAGRFIPQMQHCRRCRADASGLLGTAGRP